MKTHRLALLSALVPSMALFAGCGGGNGAAPTPPNNTPTTSPTFVGPATGAPNFPTITVPETLVLLPGGEIGFLNLKRTGGSISGDLRVPGGISSSSSLAAGVYPLSGVISLPTAVSVSNQGVGTDKFTLTGNLPTDNGKGNFTFTRGKFTAPTKVLTGQNIVTASTRYRPSGDLVFSPLSTIVTGAGGNQTQIQNFVAPVTRDGAGAFSQSSPGFNQPSGGNLQYTISKDKSTALGVLVTALRLNPGNPSLDLSLDISVTNINSGGPFTAGRTFEVGTTKNEGFVRATFNNAAGGNLSGNSGTITVRDFTSESVSLELRDVKLSSVNTTPSSSITINGIFDATGLDTLANIK